MRTPSASRASGSPSGTRRRRPNPRSRPPRAPVLTDCRLDSSHESISSVVSPASCLDPPFHTDAILSTGTPRSGERVEHSHQSTTCLFVMTKRRLSGALASARSGTAPSRLSGTPFQPRRYAFHLTPPLPAIYRSMAAIRRRHPCVRPIQTHHMGVILTSPGLRVWTPQHERALVILLTFAWTESGEGLPPGSHATKHYTRTTVMDARHDVWNRPQTPSSIPLCHQKTFHADPTELRPIVHPSPSTRATTWTW